jgi:hypothetical protein
MNRTAVVATVLLGVGVFGIVAPLAFPPGDVYKHDTTISWANPDNQTAIQQSIQDEDIEVFSYSNLSDRGQQIYLDALETEPGANYWTKRPAPDWSYDDSRMIIIQRPSDADLPPVDENDETLRYDLMTVWQGSHPIVSVSWALRVVALAVGVVSLTAAGYVVFERR